MQSQLFNFYSKICYRKQSRVFTMPTFKSDFIIRQWWWHIWQMGPPVAVSLDEVLHRVILWRGLLIMMVLLNRQLLSSFQSNSLSLPQPIH